MKDPVLYKQGTWRLLSLSYCDYYHLHPYGTPRAWKRDQTDERREEKQVWEPDLILWSIYLVLGSQARYITLYVVLVRSSAVLPFQRRLSLSLLFLSSTLKKRNESHNLGSKSGRLNKKKEDRKEGRGEKGGYSAASRRLESKQMLKKSQLKGE